MMKRRDVLKAGAAGAATVAVAGTGGLGATGCATVQHVDPATSDRAARGFLVQLDKQLRLADHGRLVEGFVAAAKPGPRTPEKQAQIDRSDGLMRRVMRTLFITQSFRDLDPEVQLHPAVQERLESHMEEIDTTVFELSDFLAGQTPEQRARLRDTLRQQPDTAMQIGEELDRHAAAVGVSPERRKQLRSMMSQATFRMRTEAPGAIIDEYTAKVERLRGQDGSSALALSLSEKMGQRAFWRYQQYLTQSSAPGTTAADPSMAASNPGASTPTGAQRRKSSSGKRAMRGGAYMMGIGVIVFGLSALLVNAATGFVVGMTVGALLVSIGFVTLIVGAIMDAS